MSGQISVHFSLVSQNGLKSDLKMSRIWTIFGKSDIHDGCLSTTTRDVKFSIQNCVKLAPNDKICEFSRSVAVHFRSPRNRNLTSLLSTQHTRTYISSNPIALTAFELWISNPWPGYQLTSVGVYLIGIRHLSEHLQVSVYGHLSHQLTLSDQSRPIIDYHGRSLTITADRWLQLECPRTPGQDKHTTIMYRVPSHEPAQGWQILVKIGPDCYKMGKIKDF